MNQSPSSSRPALIEALAGLAQRDDRAALAALRRGLGQDPGALVTMARYVEPYLSPRASRWEQDAAYLVAALFASHPQDQATPEGALYNLGAAFRLLRDRTGSDSVELRFRALLDADRAGLPVHLRHAVSLLRAHDIPVDWARLLRDLRAWNAADRWVQRAWARAFWRRSVAAGTEPGDPEPSSSTPEQAAVN